MRKFLSKIFTLTADYDDAWLCNPINPFGFTPSKTALSSPSILTLPKNYYAEAADGMNHSTSELTSKVFEHLGLKR